MRLSKLKTVLFRTWYNAARKSLRKRIFRKYGSDTTPDVQEVLAFLNANPSIQLPLGMQPPYEWAHRYMAEEVHVERDATCGMLFAEVDKRRVFFPRGSTVADVQQAVRIARMEQDPRSPHCYLCGEHKIDTGDVGVFVGASDGMVCASVIDKLSRAFLFEPDPKWVEPLRMTFQPWIDKVEIVQLALGAKDSVGVTRLDTFFLGKSLPNYIQMDVDGAEWDVLQGARAILAKAAKLRLSVCTYHRRLDYQRFAKFLGELGFAISHSPGYYLIGVRMPYLRRGVLYASRVG